MNVIRKISIVMGVDELKSAIQHWIAQTDIDIANHLANNNCNFVISENVDGSLITIDISGEFVDNFKKPPTV